MRRNSTGATATTAAGGAQSYSVPVSPRLLVENRFQSVALVVSLQSGVRTTDRVRRRWNTSTCRCSIPMSTRALAMMRGRILANVQAAGVRCDLHTVAPRRRAALRRNGSGSLPRRLSARLTHPGYERVRANQRRLPGPIWSRQILSLGGAALLARQTVAECRGPLARPKPQLQLSPLGARRFVPCHASATAQAACVGTIDKPSTPGPLIPVGRLSVTTLHGDEAGTCEIVVQETLFRESHTTLQ